MWAYATRTLTQSAASVVAAVSGSNITVRRGDYTSIALTGLGAIPAGRTGLWFTVKEDPEGDADTAAIIQVEETKGLLYLNGAAGTAAQATLTVDDEAAGNITIVLTDTATAQLSVYAGIDYDVQYLDASGAAITMTAGMFTVTADSTRAIVAPS